MAGRGASKQWMLLLAEPAAVHQYHNVQTRSTCTPARLEDRFTTETQPSIDRVCRCRSKASGHLHHIASLWPLLPLDDFELYLIAFLKTLIAFAGDRAVVHKDIGTIFTSDESKSLCIVEPLHGSLETRHLLFLRASCYRRRCRRSQPARTLRSSDFGLALLNCMGQLRLLT